MLSRRVSPIARNVKHFILRAEHLSQLPRSCVIMPPGFQGHKILVGNAGRCQPILPHFLLCRSKYTKKEGLSKDEGSDSDSDQSGGEEDLTEKGSKIVSVKVPSLRADLVIKSGLQMARNKVEGVFYQSKIRINGKKILKKSAQVSDGDEIDVIRGFSPMNPDFLVVSRIEILSVKQVEEGFSVKLKRTKSLVVENYNEPWKQTQAQE